MDKSGQKTAARGSGLDGRQARVIAGAICDRGLNPRRPVNQDRYLAISEAGLFAVFDGVGGRKAGEVASQTAADTVEETFAAESNAPPTELIRRAIQIANRDIYELGQTEPAYGSMATTVALLHIDGDQATIAHVGDSRVYRLSDGNLVRETIDHTDFDDKIRAGLISPHDARERDDDHSINRALGIETAVDFELKTIDIRSGDRFLLCTDGVYRHVEDNELARVLEDFQDPQEASDEIRRMVLKRGADDNLTAIVVQVGEKPSSRDRQRRNHSAMLSQNAKDAQERTAGRRAGSRGLAPASLGSEARGGSSGTKDRIQVPLGPDTRGDSSSDDEPGRYDEEAPQEESDDLRRSNTLIYSLLVLVLVLGAFYGGLRSSNLFNKKHAASNPSDARMEQARQAYDRADFPEADQTLTGLIATDPQNSQAWYLLGRTQLQERRFADSARSLERAVELAPDMTDAYIQAAAAFEAMGNRTRAVEMLGRYNEALRKRAETAR